MKSATRSGEGDSIHDPRREKEREFKRSDERKSKEKGGKDPNPSKPNKLYSRSRWDKLLEGLADDDALESEHSSENTSTSTLTITPELVGVPNLAFS
jgi:hypothetical protein